MKHYKRIILVFLIILTVSIGLTSIAVAEMNPDPYQRIIITMLYPSIDKAITEYYGKNPRGYDLYNAKINNLESLRGWANFNVTVEVESFSGAHNPPRALEIMTFYVTLDKEPTLINYDHIDI